MQDVRKILAATSLLTICHAIQTGLIITMEVKIIREAVVKQKVTAADQTITIHHQVMFTAETAQAAVVQRHQTATVEAVVEVTLPHQVQVAVIPPLHEEVLKVQALDTLVAVHVHLAVQEAIHQVVHQVAQAVPVVQAVLVALVHHRAEEEGSTTITN